MASSNFPDKSVATESHSQQAPEITSADRSQPETGRKFRSDVLLLAFFLLVVVALTFVIKWHPLWLKVHKAASLHSVGKSIITGGSPRSPEGWQAALDYGLTYGKALWQAVVLGLITAAGVQELVPRDWLLRLFGRSRSYATLAGGLTAVPSMMCTCCSAPPAVALARSRASVGATMAYWLGNPVLNPAVIVIMGFVLGWRWAALRIVIGIVLVFGVATLAQRFFGEKDIPAAASEAAGEAAAAAAQSRRPLVQRYFTTLVRLAAGLLPEYVVIVLLLGAIRAFLFPAMTPAIGHALWLVLVLVITGTLFAIPTGGEIPIVQSLMSFGLGAAGGGALMITLPAVSLPSLAMVGRAVPARVLVFVTASVMVAGLATAGLAAALGL